MGSFGSGNDLQNALAASVRFFRIGGSQTAGSGNALSYRMLHAITALRRRPQPLRLKVTLSHTPAHDWA